MDCSKTVVAVAVPDVPTIGTVTVAPRQLRASHLHQPESIPTSDVIRPQGTVEPGGGGDPEGSKYRDGVVAAIGSGCVAERQRSDGWKSGSGVRSRGWQGWI